MGFPGTVWSPLSWIDIEAYGHGGVNEHSIRPDLSEGSMTSICERMPERAIDWPIVPYQSLHHHFIRHIIRPITGMLDRQRTQDEEQKCEHRSPNHG